MLQSVNLELYNSFVCSITINGRPQFLKKMAASGSCEFLMSHGSARWCSIGQANLSNPWLPNWRL